MMADSLVVVVENIIVSIFNAGKNYSISSNILGSKIQM